MQEHEWVAHVIVLQGKKGEPGQGGVGFDPHRTDFPAGFIQGPPGPPGPTGPKVRVGSY